ncbi:hypothetical protein P7C71_g181, partial [Lecanoromycetidae sp. Uapishka_2]
MSKILSDHKRKIIAAGVVVGGYALFEFTPLPNPFYTPGVQNIEKRYSSGGGAKNHLPGSATKRGDPESVSGNTEKAKGIGSPHYQENIGSQKADPSSFDKTWNKAQYHDDKGK